MCLERRHFYFKKWKKVTEWELIFSVVKAPPSAKKNRPNSVGKTRPNVRFNDDTDEQTFL